MKRSAKLLIATVFLCVCAAGMAREVRVGVSATPGDKQWGFYEGFFQMLGRYTHDAYRFVSLTNAEKFEALGQGRIDVVIPVVKSSENEARARFGHPFLTSEMSALLDKRQVRSVKALRGLPVCVTTRGETRAAESYGAKVVHFPRWQDKFAALEAGRCVATFGYRTGNDTFLKGAPERKRLYKHAKKFLPDPTLKMRFAVARQDASLLKGLNKALAAARMKGEYDALVRAFYGKH